MRNSTAGYLLWKGIILDFEETESERAVVLGYQSPAVWRGVFEDGKVVGVWCESIFRVKESLLGLTP